jgi:hypothetical protein
MFPFEVLNYVSGLRGYNKTQDASEKAFHISTSSFLTQGIAGSIFTDLQAGQTEQRLVILLGQNIRFSKMS